MADADLLFGVSTGGASGDSAALIAKQLNEIIKDIEPLKIRIEIDTESSKKKWNSDIKKLLSGAAQSIDLKLSTADVSKSMSNAGKGLKDVASVGKLAEKSAGNVAISYKEAEAAVKKYQKVVNDVTKNNADIVWDNIYGKYKSASGAFDETAEALNRAEAGYIRVVDAMDAMPIEERIKLQRLLTDETERFNMALEAQGGKDLSATNYADATRAVKEYYAALTKLTKTDTDIKQVDNGYMSGDQWISKIEWESESGNYAELANALNRTKTAYDLVTQARSSMLGGQQTKLQTLITQEQQKYNQVLEDQANKERLVAEARKERESAAVDAQEYSKAAQAVREYYDILLKYRKSDSDIFIDDGSFKSDSGDYEKLAEALNRTKRAYDEVSESMSAMSSESQSKLSDLMTQESNAYALSLEEIANKQRESAKATSDAVTKQVAEIKELKTHLSGIDSAYKNLLDGKIGGDLGADDIQAIKNKYIELQQAMEKMHQEGATGTNSHIEKVRSLQTELEQLLSIAKKSNDDFSAGSDANTKALTKVNDLIADITKNQREWTKAQDGTSRGSYQALSGYIDDLNKLAGLLKTGNISQEEFAESFDKVSAGVKSANKQIHAAGEATKNWKDRMGGLFGKLGQWITVTEVISKVVQTFEKMIECVVEVDTAMTELRKVTDASEETYDRFLTNATGRARELGATLSDVVTASADFARLGFSIDEASKLADAAIVYKNVADGIDDISVASENITSTMQAFGVETSDVMTIVDKFNEVSNNYAISSEGIGEALQRSAAALAAGGNTLDQSIAMITAANRIVQAPDTVGTTMKTVSMYLRAAKTEAEAAGESVDGMADSTSELRKELLALTGNKVDIQIDEDNFKSTYQILKELSEVWDELTDVSRANILEMIGGKRNANVVSALLTNFGEAEDIIETAAGSAGSALAENEKYLDSISGRIEKMKASFEALSTSVIDSGFVKSIISIADALLQVATIISDVAFDNFFTGFATIAAGGGITAFLKNLD